MPGRQRWCRHVPPVTAAVDCGGAQHRVTWRRGRLVLEDHDLAAEMALLTLGGSPCACLRVLKMWRDQWKLPPELFRQMSSWLGDSQFLAPPELSRPRALAMALNWQRAWQASSFTGRHGLLVQDELRGKALVPLSDWASRWTERLALASAPRVEVQLAPVGRPPSLSGAVRGSALTVTAALDLDWLLTVWSREAALVDDAFVLQVLASAPGDPGTPVQVARWQPAEGGGGPVTARAWLGRTRDGSWAVRSGSDRRPPRPDGPSNVAP